MRRTENIESIIFRYLSDSATGKESAILIEWLSESRENRITYFTLKKIWLSTREEGYNEKYINDSWNRLKIRTILQSQKRPKKSGLPRVNIRKLAVAATILVLLGISSFLGIKLRSLSGLDHSITEISVPLGARSNITLPDGTNVWLNAGSNLTYRSDFGRKDRSVSLTGEAYFDVKNIGSLVFTVNTRDLDVRVYGTQFNVKSYPDEDVTETTLVNGLVEVSITDPGIRAQPVLLEPNQRIVYARDTRIIKVNDEKVEVAEEIIAEDELEIPEQPRLLVSSVDNLDEYTSWKDGRLTFQVGKPYTLTPKLERFYNVNITFLDDSIKELRYTGTLNEVTIEEVIRAIASASNIKFEIEKNQITLSR
jgi:transmembrane sensor